MQRNECGIRLSVSGPMRFAGGAHATTLDPARMGGGPAPGEDSEDAALRLRHGDAHGARRPARPGAAGGSVVGISRAGVLRAEGVRAARAALAGERRGDRRADGGDVHRPRSHHPATPLDARRATVEEVRRVDTLADTLCDTLCAPPVAVPSGARP